MADPATLIAGGSMALTAAGGITSAFGAAAGGQAQSQAYTYQAGVARLNEQIAKQNADWVTQAGEVEAQQSGMKTRALIGQEKAQQAGSGLKVDSGSNALVRQSQEEVGEEDQALIRSNAAHKAYGFETEAMSEEAQARLDEYAAKNSKTAGNISAIASLLGGASSVSSKWLQARQSGIPGFAPSSV